MHNKYIEIARDIVLSIIDKEDVSVFLFGSRATDTFQRDSDIDIGFWSRETIEHRVFRIIREAMEDFIVPYHIDLVDFSTADENFKRIALESIEVWNESKGFTLK